MTRRLDTRPAAAGRPPQPPAAPAPRAVAKVRTTALRTMRPPLVVETPPRVGARRRHYGRSRAAVKPDLGAWLLARGAARPGRSGGRLSQAAGERPAQGRIAHSSKRWPRLAWASCL